MIEYILDTDTCIYWLKGKEEVRRKVLLLDEDAAREIWKDQGSI